MLRADNSLMPEAGIEPARSCLQGILSPTRSGLQPTSQSGDSPRQYAESPTDGVLVATHTATVRGGGFEPTTAQLTEESFDDNLSLRTATDKPVCAEKQAKKWQHSLIPATERQPCAAAYRRYLRDFAGDARGNV